VFIKVTIEYAIAVPDYWTRSDINFHRNESSWCASNIIRELEHANAESGTASCI